MVLFADFILVAGMLLCALAAWGLTTQRPIALPQRILLVFWIFIIGIFLYFYGNLHGLSTLVFLSNYLEDGARFIIPPLVYLYVKSLVFPSQNSFWAKNAIHITPFLIYLSAYTIPKSISAGLFYLPWIDATIDWALIQDLFGIFYFLLSLKIYYRYKSNIYTFYSEDSKHNFLWLERFLYSFMAVLLFDLCITISEIYFAYNVNWDGYITVFFLVLALVHLGYYGLRQRILFFPERLDNHLTTLVQPVGLKPQAPYLSSTERESLHKSYRICMEEQQLFLRPDLDLDSLATCMQTSPRKLSAFLNGELGLRFYDAVNTHRVEEAKAQLQSSLVQRHSITGIGLSCGFSSKSSFFRVFKKHTSLTPSAYREAMLRQKESQPKQ